MSVCQIPDHFHFKPDPLAGTGDDFKGDGDNVACKAGCHLGISLKGHR